MRPQVGQVINNKYRLLRLIGDGGMGAVYEARHEVLGTSVALKFLHAELGKRPGLVQRFLQEARVSAQIQSPHVVRVTDVDQTAGGRDGGSRPQTPGHDPQTSGAFIVMEYIEGRTLQTLYEELYKAGLQLSYTDALEYAMQMLEGVEAAHRSGIVHRDLKPDNVMITLDAKGRALIKILDFGIAKLKVAAEVDRGLTRPGVIMGTPEYMAPEQAFSADAVDARADIFSLGVIIFEMLAGRRPVGGEDPHQIAGAYLSGQIARITDLAPDIDPELGAAVHRAMAASAADRWQTVTDLRDAMEPFAVAAKAPSVMSTTSLSRVSLTSGILAAPRLSVELDGGAPAGQRSVPKTLPPEDDGTATTPATPPEAMGTPAPKQVGANPDTSPADPPRMSDAPQRGPTPLGGFGSFSEGTAAEQAANAVPAAAGPAFIPPTRSVAPLSASRGDPAATALASPMGPHVAFAAHPAGAGPTGSPRPNGTAISDEASTTAPSYAGAPFHGSAAPALHAPAPAMPMPYPPPAIGGAGSPQRRPGALSSLPAILLLAAAVSAAVVGGVYIAHSRAKTDDHEDPPATTAPPTTVAADPPPNDAPDPPVAPTATVAQPWRPTSPLKPPLKGSAGPVVPTAPTSTGPRVPVIPSVLPPFILPSNLPFDFPLLPSRPREDPPRGQQPAPRDRPPRGEPPQSPRGERMMMERPAYPRPSQSRWGRPPYPRPSQSRWGRPPYPRPSRPRPYAFDLENVLP